MNIISHYKIWFLISALVIIPGVIALSIWRLNVGIDFKGGTITTIKVEQGSTKREDVLSALIDLKLKDLNVQPLNDNQFQIRTATTGTHLDQDIAKILEPKVGKSQIVSFESIGPTVSQEMTTRAFIAILIASLAIVIYIAYAFRRLPKPASSWRFGICAVAALIHDTLFVVGLFAILGHFLGYEVNSLFITALLTIMGFSVHDTIVVFDRIRENLKLSPTTPFIQNVNNSVIQTLARSLNTSLTVLIVLLAMYLLGGESIKQFVLTLLAGIAIGTYSSIFNASPLLVVWQNWLDRRRERQPATV